MTSFYIIILYLSIVSHKRIHGFVFLCAEKGCGAKVHYYASALRCLAPGFAVVRQIVKSQLLLFVATTAGPHSMGSGGDSQLRSHLTHCVQQSLSPHPTASVEFALFWRQPTVPLFSCTSPCHHTPQSAHSNVCCLWGVVTERGRGEESRQR